MRRPPPLTGDSNDIPIHPGARAPDVELEVDHKIPVSRGGTDDEKNLITKCFNCNRGKGDLI